MNPYLQALISTVILSSPAAFMVWLDTRRPARTPHRAGRTAPRPDVSSSTSGRVERHRRGSVR